MADPANRIRPSSSFALEVEDGLLWLYAMDPQGFPQAVCLGEPDYAAEEMCRLFGDIEAARQKLLASNSAT